MNEKKRKDTLAILRSQLSMTDERLKDKQYIPIWDVLKMQQDKLILEINKLSK